jgi:Ca-activated chloride channel family protein
MTFDPDDPRLTAYALGELEARERAEVEAWLEEEPDARRSVDELRCLARLLGTLLRAEASPGLGAEQKRAIARELERDPQAGALPFPGSRRWSVLARYAVLAAALLLACTVSLRLLINRQQAEQRERAPAARTEMFGRSEGSRADGPAGPAKDSAARPSEPARESESAFGFAVPNGAPAVAEAPPAPPPLSLRSMSAPAEAADESLFQRQTGFGAVALEQAPAAPVEEPADLKEPKGAISKEPRAAPDRRYFYAENATRAAPQPANGSAAKSGAPASDAASAAPGPPATGVASSAPKDGDMSRGLSGGGMARGMAPAANAPLAQGALGRVEVRRSGVEPAAGGAADAGGTKPESSQSSMQRKLGSVDPLDSKAGRDLASGDDRSALAAGSAAPAPAPTGGRAQAPSGQPAGASRFAPRAGAATGMAGLSHRAPESQARAAAAYAPGGLGAPAPAPAQKPGQLAGKSAQDAQTPTEGPRAEGLEQPGKLHIAQVREQAGEAGRERQLLEQDQGPAELDKLVKAKEVLGEEPLPENEPVLVTPDTALSTFAIDVDTGSYSNIRRFLRQETLPPPGAVRIEEMLNYFTWSYPAPAGDAPIAIDTELTRCPWNPDNRLLRIGLRGKAVRFANRQPSNLVFLVDVSGSMNQPNKLPLAKTGLRMLVEQLGENDKISVATYAGREGVALPATSGSNRAEILSAIDQLAAGGSTNGEAGYQLAYNLAVENFIQGGINRVILCSDGDFNVGATRLDELTAMATEKAKTGVFLNVLGFGDGNLKEKTLEQLADKGNGQYAYIDDLLEARKVFVEQIDGTLVTIAKDVKVQVEFRPNHVGSYRLLGYENRRMADADFRNDAKDAGEIGSGLTVTALYELTPPGPVVPGNNVALRNDGLRSDPNTLAIVRFRYKPLDGAQVPEISHPVQDATVELGAATSDTRFASAVAMFGMILRHSKYQGQATLDAVLELAEANRDPDPGGYRAEFVSLVQKAREISVPVAAGAK